MIVIRSQEKQRSRGWKNIGKHGEEREGKTRLKALPENQTIEVQF